METQKNTGMAALSYIGILVLIPLLTEAKKDSYVKFHIKQGLVLLIAEIATGIVAGIPVLGWIAAPIIYLFLFVLFIMGLINALGGKEQELPLIGQFGNKFNI